MKFWCARMLAGAALLSISAIAHAQAPTKAQQDAIRSNCRSDFMKNCSSVTPGGREALECLIKNKAGASAGCQGALNAIAAPAPAAAKPEPKPEPKAEMKAEPKSAAKPEPAAPGAALPASAPPPAARRPAPVPKAVAAPARPAAPVVPPPAAPVAVAPSPPPPVTHQPKLGEAVLIRRFCTTDFRVLCKGVPLGQGRAVQCLASNAAALSPGCRDVMMKTGELQP
jgi:hypothetical protein